MKNIFLDEASRAVNHGGLEGTIYMIFKYGNFSMVDDEGMSIEEKISYGTEMLDIEVKNFEKRKKMVKQQNSICYFLIGLILIGLVIALFSTDYLSADETMVISVLSLLISCMLIYETEESKSKNTNLLVLFWVAYVERMLFYVDDLAPEVTFPAAIKVGNAIKDVS
ncbi:hypothetical protein IJI89_00040 [Candidatus Saccharibacteria bacterium]|nr:hypothetical protein [Candidatus Saccharibacteria bacterium]